MAEMTKVHRIVLLVVDDDNLGADGVRKVLENARHHCISPQVMACETREVEWSDEHPLNMTTTQRDAFEELFGDVSRARR